VTKFALDDGWYLMSTRDLELELARRNNPVRDAPRSNAVKLEVQEALSYRDAGNLPDEMDRSLRLVLNIEGSEGLHGLDARRRITIRPPTGAGQVLVR
jgi:hypothetical protein